MSVALERGLAACLLLAVVVLLMPGTTAPAGATVVGVVVDPHYSQHLVELDYGNGVIDAVAISPETSERYEVGDPYP